MSELSEQELEAVAGGKGNGCQGTPADVGSQYNWLELA
jgi:bacteriocin-like protein